MSILLNHLLEMLAFMPSLRSSIVFFLGLATLDLSGPPGFIHLVKLEGMQGLEAHFTVLYPVNTIFDRTSTEQYCQ